MIKHEEPHTLIDEPDRALPHAPSPPDRFSRQIVVESIGLGTSHPTRRPARLPNPPNSRRSVPSDAPHSRLDLGHAMSAVGLACIVGVRWHAASTTQKRREYHCQLRRYRACRTWEPAHGFSLRQRRRCSLAWLAGVTAQRAQVPWMPHARYVVAPEGSLRLRGNDTLLLQTDRLGNIRRCDELTALYLTHVQAR